MVNFTRTFVKGRMNKAVDVKLVPDGEYIEALNARLNSSEGQDIGVLENSKGNELITALVYDDGTTLYNLSSSARTIGAIADQSLNSIFWFVHDPTFSQGATGKLDLVVSYNFDTQVLKYHVVSIDDGGGTDTTLNFDPEYLITGVDIVDDFLFWTDNLNPPRKINIKRSYARPVANVDVVTAEELLNIKKPPLNKPEVTLADVSNSEYLEDRFICFAYRYRYADGEYSATSPFSQPAFEPEAFDFDPATFLNEGMVNQYNAAIVEVDTGGSLVVGFDILFKEADSNVIKVIEKIDKDIKGVPDNSTYSITFTSSKIFTVLPDSEILRLYDNVPLLAKAQTLMGNRLVYGNYVEGYDLEDSNGNPIKLDYSVDLISEEPNTLLADSDLLDFTYTVDGSVAVTDSILTFDLTGISLKTGYQLNFDIVFEQGGTSSKPAPVSQFTDGTTISFSFVLPRDYADVTDLITSEEFKAAIGTSSNIKPIYNASGQTSCDGVTFTDVFYCSIPSDLSGYTKFDATSYSGSSGSVSPLTGENLEVYTCASLASALPVSGGSFLAIILPVVRFVDNPLSISTSWYEYYTINSASVTIDTISSSKSLRSDRSYEIAIAYLDDFGRSTTALTSADNDVYIECGKSTTKNEIEVTIPITQKPPSWATHYKFYIKADKEGYETVYSHIFVSDPNDVAFTYFLLDGENANKVSIGDTLIVKSDINGARINCTETTVLEKGAQEENFLGDDTPSPEGVYMKVKSTSFSSDSRNTYFDFGVLNSSSKDQFSFDITEGGSGRIERNGSKYPYIAYPVFKTPGVDIDIPQGSRVKMDITFERKGTREGEGGCERRVYEFNETYTSSADYANFLDWFEGDNIAAFIDDGTKTVGDEDNSDPIKNEYLNETLFTSESFTDLLSDLPASDSINYWGFKQNSNGIYLLLTGTRQCGTSGKNRISIIKCQIQIFTASEVIFETEPQDASPDIFFESSKTYEISGGNHLGNGPKDTNQNIGTGTAGVIRTDFFNCYTFGNGAESYKIKDSVAGRSITLGNRVNAVAAQDYKRAHRFADLTYSGVYNDESNVNKLNEFNLGLVNYKALEDSFGDIQVIDGRLTDILVLQEDKISYVLAGKNLLSDSTGGGSITSVPEVLGTQIARNDEYGISKNPESYVHWGNDRYFTDARRGAVIRLVGSSAQSDQLLIISKQLMRTWFRDLFINALNAQKLGGYDPYMDEYVLSSNDIALPVEIESEDCGQTQTIEVAPSTTESFIVDLGEAVGDSTVSYFPLSLASINFNVTANYNGSDTSSGTVTTAGTVVFTKSEIDVKTATISIQNLSATETLTIQVTPGCPVPVSINVVQIVVTNDDDAGETIHAEFSFEDGTYLSPSQSTPVVFQEGAAPLTSKYNRIEGNQGEGVIPTNGSTVSIIINKKNTDSYSFDTSKNRFLYLRSNTLYTGTPGDLSTLLGLATLATPINTLVAGKTYSAEFTMPGTGTYLYLIYDMRNPTTVDLTYSAVDADTACCS